MEEIKNLVKLLMTNDHANHELVYMQVLGEDTFDEDVNFLTKLYLTAIERKLTIDNLINSWDRSKDKVELTFTVPFLDICLSTNLDPKNYIDYNYRCATQYYDISFLFKGDFERFSCNSGWMYAASETHYLTPCSFLFKKTSDEGVSFSDFFLMHMKEQAKIFLYNNFKNLKTE